MAHQVSDGLVQHISICQIRAEGVPEYVQMNMADPHTLGAGLHRRPRGFIAGAERLRTR